MTRAPLLVAFASLTVFASVGCGSAERRSDSPTRSDPPLLVPWSRVGDIALGEPRAQVTQEYGRQRGSPQPFYPLHGGRVWVTYDRADQVAALGFTTAYYRTKGGFGVGSRIPLGPCHRTATNGCEHRWHGFVYDVRLREDPCKCWVKVGLGAESLPATGANFLKPWFIIYTRHGRASELYFALKYID